MNAPEYRLKLPVKCPPDGAFSADMVLYRIVSKDVFCDEDLVSYAEKNITRFKNHCLAHGLSFYAKKSDAVVACKDAEARRKTLGTHVARCSIESTHGTMHTKDESHYTLWLFSKVDASRIKCLSVSKISDKQ